MSDKHQKATAYLRALEAYAAAKAEEQAAYSRRNAAEKELQAAKSAFARAATAGEGVILEGKIVTYNSRNGYDDVAVLTLG